MRANPLFAAVFAVFMLVCSASAAERDVQDFVCLGDKRQVLIRFHIQIDGKPLVDLWKDFMDKLFVYLDRNGDGVLNKDEASRVPPVPVLFNSSPNFVGVRPIVPEALDNNRDGTITRAELDDWYRRIGATPLQIHVVPAHNQLADRPNVNPTQTLSAMEINERLFSLFDADKDGTLSLKELANAPAVLHRLDLDEDESISIQELSDYLAGKEGTLASSPGLSVDRFGFNGPLVPLEPMAMKKDLGQRVPDLEIAVRLGERTNRQRGLELIQVKKEPPLPSKSARFTFGGMLVLELGRTRIELSCGERERELRIELQRLRRMYRAQFLKSDLDANGYLDAKEAIQTPLFRNSFRLMDRDGDGKLYEREIVSYLDKMRELQETAVRSCVTLEIKDQGRGLFDFIDVNKDGRLGVREIRQMPKLVDQLDRDGDSRINRGEIPHKYRVDVLRGPAMGNPFAQRVVIASKIGEKDQPDLPERNGPLWFQKMDRNRDGDVSRHEFLGTDEEFRRIDRDGDGLISIEEAQRADRVFRKEKERY